MERLQEDFDLPVTGLLDPASQAALAEVLGQQESAQVAALQGILTATGHYGGPIDGVWSPEVEEALKELQTDLGVPATGVVDAATLRAFEAALVEAGVRTTADDCAPGTTPPAPATTSPAPTTTVPAATTTRPATTQPPPTVPVVEDNILDVLAAAGQFGQLLAAIDAAGLTEIVRAGPVHAVRSTDEAFSQLAEPLPTEPEALQAVLLYHVVEDNLSGFELMGMTSVPTAQGTDSQARSRPARSCLTEHRQ